MVPTSSIAIIGFDMFFGIAVPVALAIYFHIKYKARIASFFIGALAMFLFAFVLEQLVHVAVLGSSLGTAIQSNIYLYGLYGGLAAGLFEETGRYAMMSVFLKNSKDEPQNALMYGAGHGGLEMMILLTLGMLNNFIYSIMINNGTISTVLEALDDTTRETLQAGLDELISSSPTVFLMSPIERIGAIVLQIALSVLVWIAVTQAGKKYMYVIAILIHAFVDCSVVIISQYVSVMVTELIVWIYVIVISFFAYKLWKANGFDIKEKSLT